MAHQECDKCGVFGPCNKEGICNDCIFEEYEDEEDQEDEDQED